MSLTLTHFLFANISQASSLPTLPSLEEWTESRSSPSTLVSVSYGYVALLMSHQPADERGLEAPENQAFGQTRLARPAPLIVPDRGCFGGAWSSKMKPLSVPAWSWKSWTATHSPVFPARPGFINDLVILFIFWRHSCQTLQHESIHVARYTTHPVKLALTPEPIHHIWTLGLGIQLQHTHWNHISWGSFQSHPVKSQLMQWPQRP